MTFLPATIVSRAPRLPALIAALKDRLSRFSLPARLERMSDQQLQDAGLLRSDADCLRCHGTSQDAATGLAIRAGQRAGNW